MGNGGRSCWRKIPPRTLEMHPGDFPVGSLQSRVAARAALAPQVIFTVIFDVPDLPLNLESSGCKRLLWPNGAICELVYLHGRSSDMSQEQLSAFIERYPVLPG